MGILKEQLNNLNQNSIEYLGQQKYQTNIKMLKVLVGIPTYIKSKLKTGFYEFNTNQFEETNNILNSLKFESENIKIESSFSLNVLRKENYDVFSTSYLSDGYINMINDVCLYIEGKYGSVNTFLNTPVPDLNIDLMMLKKQDMLIDTYKQIKDYKLQELQNQIADSVKVKNNDSFKDIFITIFQPFFHLQDFLLQNKVFEKIKVLENIENSLVYNKGYNRDGFQINNKLSSLYFYELFFMAANGEIDLHYFTNDETKIYNFKVLLKKIENL